MADKRHEFTHSSYALANQLDGCKITLWTLAAPRDKHSLTNHRRCYIPRSNLPHQYKAVVALLASKIFIFVSFILDANAQNEINENQSYCWSIYSQCSQMITFFFYSLVLQQYIHRLILRSVPWSLNIFRTFPIMLGFSKHFSSYQ